MYNSRNPDETEGFPASPPPVDLDLERLPATPPGGQAGPSNATTPAQRRQRATSSAAVHSGRARAQAAKAKAYKDTKTLRRMQQTELDQKVEESKAMERLLNMRTEKEEAQVELLKQQKRHEEELHKQKLDHADEIHMAKLVDMGVDLDDLRRRPPCFDAETQTE